ncbi:hypothetical protein [Rhizobium sp. 2MFCol3.1]|uniref:hypothetical protein n=1 Tax=Rhizobium sp. 2MFCol3.1 TaxID=1246459 RepID=UPI00036190AB|nr:hypothetical protein [Rhizobium sp. 2MFCol3.1]
MQYKKHGRLGKLAKSAALLAAFATLASCATNPNSTKMGADGKDAARQADAMVADKGAAAVVRVSLNGSYCVRGTVRLQKVVDGKIGSGPFTEIGQPNGLYGGDAIIKNLAKTTAQMLTLNVPALIKENGVRDIRTSFRPIEPGRYAVTMITCQNGNSIASMGTGNAGFWGVQGKEPQYTLLGDNTITIGKGQIVDAGVIDIVQMSSGGFFSGAARGRLVGSQAPQTFKDAIRLNVPEIYSRITYTKFTADYELLLSSITSKAKAK